MRTVFTHTIGNWIAYSWPSHTLFQTTPPAGDAITELVSKSVDSSFQHEFNQ